MSARPGDTVLSRYVSISQTRRRAERDIAATPKMIFDLLSDPSQHHRFDASTMVGQTVTPIRPTAIGDVFTMEMTYQDENFLEHYRTDNYITDLVTDRLIEWEVAPHGRPRLGWRWRYELRRNGPATHTSLIYDWSRTPSENLKRYGVPAFDHDDLADSLALLAAAMS